MQISERDTRKLLGLVAELAAMEDLENFRAAAPEAVQVILACDLASYNEVPTEAGAPVVVRTNPPGSIVPELAANFQRLLGQHPLICHYRVTHDPRPLAISDLMPALRFARLELYASFFARLGLRDQLAITLDGLPGATVGIAFNRSRRGFTTREHERLALIRPSLCHAYGAVVRRQRHRLTDERDRWELTPRELEILNLVREGHSDRQIAVELFLSPRTVHNHLQHAYRKLGVTNRTSALRRLTEGERAAAGRDAQ